MWLFSRFFRYLAFAALVSACMKNGANAQNSSVDPSGWQSSITAQIEAFREKNAEGALEYAGVSFKLRYRDADDFYAAIRRSGYQPIIESRSHEFGPFTLGEDAIALQVVELVGPDQGLYSALYQLAEEPEGWRVQSVILRKKPGIGI